MIETVTPETARAVKKAGWKRETIAHYYDEGLCWFTTSGTELNLPAPALPELLEELSFEDIRDYIKRNLNGYSAFDVYTTMRSVEECAKVWVWKQKKGD